MDLQQLLQLVNSAGRKVRVRTDSRQISPGDVFVAVKGNSFDGHDFIDQAAGNGAKYIVSNRFFENKNAEVIVVDDTANAAALLAQAAFGNPASKLVNLAVTGTNGKTTVAYLVRSVIQTAQKKCGLVGTVHYDTGRDTTAAELTTPDCLSIAKMQSRMTEAGCQYMVIEASSHALSQNRLAGIDFKAAAFTNLAGDHLDYHGTTENYLTAKSILFENLSSDSVAVLNKQAPETVQISKRTKAGILWYGVETVADITAVVESMDINQTVFRIEYGGSSQEVTTPLLGTYNISNHLAAAGLCLAAGFSLKQVAEGLSALKNVPGRLERIESNGDFTVLVDYAHTDDALKNVLSTLKPLCKGRLIVVFGCGGDRDKTKRPRMAAVAEQLADIVIVTSDNPRTEHPAAIIGDIVVGFENPTADTIFTEADRQKAIELAIKQARRNDIVLIAGKGHETYQIIANERIDFSDVDIALKYLGKSR